MDLLEEPLELPALTKIDESSLQTEFCLETEIDLDDVWLWASTAADNNEIPLDAAVTKKLTSDMIYNWKHDRSLSIPEPPPPSPVTPIQKVGRCTSEATGLENPAVNEIIAASNFEVNDILEEFSPGKNTVDITLQDLNQIFDENASYCNKIYDRNPWEEYLQLDKRQQIIQRVSTVNSPKHWANDFEDFFEKMGTVLDPEEIKATFGIDLDISLGKMYFQCDRCCECFPSQEECQDHMNTDDECEFNLINTSVGMNLAL